MINMIETPKSSSIHSYGYGELSETLAVRFRTSNKVYHYTHVPIKVFNFMKAADSVGQYVNNHVKGKYPFKHIEEKEKTK